MAPGSFSITWMTLIMIFFSTLFIAQLNISWFSFLMLALVIADTFHGRALPNSLSFLFSSFSTFKLSNHSCLQVLVESYDRFLEFMQRSKVVVSPTFALETATALQVTLSVSWLLCFDCGKLNIYLFVAKSRWKLRKWLVELKSSFKWY